MPTIFLDRTTLQKAKRDPATGFLRGEARFTKVGIFRYPQQDGSFRLSLRAPEAVFEPESIASLALQTIVVEHPPEEWVTTENVGRVQVGTIGQPRQDGDYLVADYVITNEHAIEQILNGARVEISCGYSADSVQQAGKWRGRPYTHVQSNIRYNHAAITWAGRAGPDVRFVTDSNTEVHTGEEDMFKITVEGVEMSFNSEADRDKFMAAHTRNTTRFNDSVAVEQRAQGTIDALKQEIASLKAATPTDAQVQARVQARINLVESARHLDSATDFKTLSDREVMVTALKATSKDDFTGKSDDYVLGRFEAAIAVKSETRATVPNVVNDAKNPASTTAAPSPGGLEGVFLDFNARQKSAHLNKNV